MNNSNQAQKGFKTFILTLSVSLIIFSVVYYFVSQNSSITPDEEKASSGVQSANIKDVEKKNDQEKQAAKPGGESVFKKLADSKVTVPQRTVLAGATTAQTTQSTTTVPQTGTTEITLGLVFSAVIFSIGLSIIRKGPRNIALASFEKRVIKDL